MRTNPLFVLIAALSLTGCAVVSRLQSMTLGNDRVTQDELRDSVLEFSSTFWVLVVEAADRISQGTTDASQRRLTLLWKIRMPPLAQEAASDPNPRRGYVEALTVAVAQRQYFQEGAGKTLFGAQQAVALDAAEEIERDAVRLGGTFLSAKQLADLREEVEALARNHPIRGEFLREGIQVGLASAETGGAFDDILSIPMAPFRAVAGVEAGAQAIHEMNATAAQFTDVVDSLPQRVRWQMELLSYDLQAQGGVLAQSLDSFHTVAESASRLSFAAERLPEDTRAAILSTSDELEKRSATLKALLAEYRGAIGDTGATAESATKLVEAVSRTSEQLNQAGVAWSGLVQEFRAPSPPPPPGQPPPKPFDIEEYAHTAVEIRQTADSLRALLADLAQTRAGVADQLADRLMRDGVILIVVFFAALLGYRVAASRIAPRRRAP